MFVRQLLPVNHELGPSLSNSLVYFVYFLRMDVIEVNQAPKIFQVRCSRLNLIFDLANVNVCWLWSLVAGVAADYLYFLWGES